MALMPVTVTQRYCCIAVTGAQLHPRCSSVGTKASIQKGPWRNLLTLFGGDLPSRERWFKPESRRKCVLMPCETVSLPSSSQPHGTGLFVSK